VKPRKPYLTRSVVEGLLLRELATVRALTARESRKALLARRWLLETARWKGARGELLDELVDLEQLERALANARRKAKKTAESGGGSPSRPSANKSSAKSAAGSPPSSPASQLCLPGSTEG